ncbi:hypothetical protein [Chryseobacterium sp. Leaf405]|nr:hypothetical protein [Chryseobacterium sp. Leaf405]
MGFEHPQSFSKLFKIKTDMSPLEFRNSFVNSSDIDHPIPIQSDQVISV